MKIILPLVFLLLLSSCGREPILPLYGLKVGDIVYSKIGVKGVVSSLTHCDGGFQCWWEISWMPNMNLVDYSTNAKLRAVLSHPSTWPKQIGN